MVRIFRGDAIILEANANDQCKQHLYFECVEPRSSSTNQHGILNEISESSTEISLSHNPELNSVLHEYVGDDVAKFPKGCVLLWHDKILKLIQCS